MPKLPIRGCSTWKLDPPTLVAATLVLVTIMTMILGFGHQNGWMVEDNGHARASEYTGVRAAGALALQGRPAAVYDAQIQQSQLEVIIGHPSVGEYPFGYPPTYLPIAMALASLPLVAGAIAWIVATLVLYAGAAMRITGLRAAGIWAAASPAAAVNANIAHTGFWTAGLFGFALDALPRRPVLAGVLFGLMSMKPQLALLIPVALVAGRHWQTLAVAGLTAVAGAAASVAAFGLAPWFAMLAQQAHISEAVRDGRVPLEMLVSIYGAARAVGFADAPALGVQALVSAALVVGIYRLWRSNAHYELKAAALVSASVLATPYLFIYDLTMLTIVVAFLVRQNGIAGVRSSERALLGCAGVLLLLFSLTGLPLGFIADVLVGAVVAGRCRSANKWRHTLAERAAPV